MWSEWPEFDSHQGFWKRSWSYNNKVDSPAVVYIPAASDMLCTLLVPLVFSPDMDTNDNTEGSFLFVWRAVPTFARIWKWLCVLWGRRFDQRERLLRPLALLPKNIVVFSSRQAAGMRPQFILCDISNSLSLPSHITNTKYILFKERYW